MDSASPTNLPLVNASLLVRLKPDLRSKLVTMFLEQVPQLLQQIDHNIEAADANGLKETAHHLKGSCLSIGVIDMERYCKELQLQGEKGNLSNANELAKRLKQSYEQTREELMVYISEQ